MTLQDTVALMNSADYKERFKAEYLSVGESVQRVKENVGGMGQGEN